ncbi:MAG TPA: CHAT domain-containing protein [Gemmatimonadales bacterium]|nr:CHAT domain-containing protein [Gemmatimonadales bacterium]
MLAATRAVEGDSVGRVRARWLASAGDPVAEIGLATLDRLTYDYAAADRRYGVLARSPDQVTRRYAAIGRATGLAARWQRDSALPQLYQLVRESRDAGDLHAELLALLATVRLETRSLAPDSVDLLIRRAEAIVARDDPQWLAVVRCQRAAWLRVTAPERADSVVALGLAAARRSAVRRVEGACRFVRGTIEAARGRGEAALAEFQRAEAIARAAHDLDVLAGAQQWSGARLLSFSPEIAEGRRRALAAIASAERAGSTVTAAFARMNLAQFAVRFGDPSASMALLDTAEVALRQVGDARGLAGADWVRGEAAMLAGRYAEAYAHYERASQRHIQLGMTSARAGNLLSQAAALRSLGQPEPARVHREAAESLARASASAGLLTGATYERAMQALASGRWSEALDDLARFERMTRRTFSHYGYDIHMRRAEAFAGAGRFAAAERSLDSAAAVFHAWRSGVSDRTLRVALLGSRRMDYDPDVGTAMTVARLSAAGRIVPALRAAEARRAQELWQQTLRLAVLAGQAAATGTPSETHDLARLPDELPKGAAVLAYVAGERGVPTTLFVVTRAGIAARALLPGDSLAPSIDRVLALLPTGADANGLRRRLGDALVAPALPLLAGVTRLVIVPDGPLHRVPFDALLLPDGRAAIDRFSISVAPSVRIASRWWTDDRPGRRHGVLAFADPVYDPATGLARLAASGTEGRALESRIAGVRLLTREAASEAALKRASLRGLGLLHLATHARVQDQGILESALFLAPGAGEDGRVGPEEIARLQLDVDLVVLSGCRTVGGAITAGEGVQGLTAPFLEAGARAVAATYWEVGDRAMAEFMEGFYTELAAGRTAGDALRLAKLAARRAGAPVGAWAAMTLIGDPDVVPTFAAKGRPRG